MFSMCCWRNLCLSHCTPVPYSKFFIFFFAHLEMRSFQFDIVYDTGLQEGKIHFFHGYITNFYGLKCHTLSIHFSKLGQIICHLQMFSMWVCQFSMWVYFLVPGWHRHPSCCWYSNHSNEHVTLRCRKPGSKLPCHCCVSTPHPVRALIPLSQTSFLYPRTLCQYIRQHAFSCA